MSIVRIGLAETKNFSQGYAAIFGSRKKKEDEPTPSKPAIKKKTPKTSKKKGKK